MQARRMAAARFSAFSRSITVERWKCTVRSFNPMMSAACLAVWPSARTRRTSLPRSVRPNRRSMTSLLRIDEFNVSQPNLVWVTDITYIRTHEGWLYLAVVLDLFSRQIVGWSMQPRIDRELALNALLMAVWRRRPTNEVMVHSDQGSQGGFNRSSQHLIMKVLYGTTCRVDVEADGARGDALARCTVASA